MGLAASKQEEFWEACGFGNVHRAKQLLEEGEIDINWVSYANDCCPIHVASQGKPEIVKMLIDRKCNLNVRDNRDNLALHHAAMKGHADIVTMLIDAGSEINAQEKNGWTALHKAAYWCHLDVVKILLKNGSHVNIKNNDERTALQECARSQGRDEVRLGEIARLLIDAGSDTEGKSSDWGEADLTGLMYASFHNHPEVASVLIKAGCDLNAVGTTFWSALHWAADRGNDELVYLLLEAGIDPTLRDMKGDTALERAKSDDIRETLREAIELQKEVRRANTIPILQAKPVPAAEFKPACDVHFKSQSFLPKDWKPASSVDIKNLINEKKSRLAAMTSQKYREDLARRTGTKVIADQSVVTETRGKSEGLSCAAKDNVVDTNTDSDCTNDVTDKEEKVITSDGTDSTKGESSEVTSTENLNSIGGDDDSYVKDICQNEDTQQTNQTKGDYIDTKICESINNDVKCEADSIVQCITELDDVDDASKEISGSDKNCDENELKDSDNGCTGKEGS